MAARSAGAKKPKDQPAALPAYVVFARRFRPQSFQDVVGQETTTASLKMALRKGRLAQAYLLAGPRGVGKTSLARIFAKALNCLRGKGPGGVGEEPCNECDACAAIQDGSALDVIEMDAATHRGIEEIRTLRDNVGLAPSQFRYKVYIVDEVHMLTMEAWNAFLKTLEEPPPHVKFIFATTNAEKIPETILSRCQRYDLRRIGLGDIVRRLTRICEGEGLSAETGALERIAGLAKGGLRDAESLLDQVVNLGDGRITDEAVRRIAGAAPDELLFAVLTACAKGELREALTRSAAALEAGADPDDLLAAFCERLRGVLLAKTCGPDTPLLEGQSHLKDAYAALAGLLSEDQVLLFLQLFANAQRQVKDAAQARLPLEMALVRASRVKELVDLGKLVMALESGAAPARSAPERPGAREGPRPNSFGRPASPDGRLAAERTSGEAVPAPGRLETAPASHRDLEAPPGRAPQPPAPASAFAPPQPAARAGAPERWGELLGAVKARPGGIMLVAALSNAPGVRLDLAAGTLDLAFTPAQGGYREMLERPERTAALREALAEVYGRALEVSFSRVERGSAMLTAGAASPVLAPTPAAGEAPAPPPRVARAGPPAPVGSADPQVGSKWKRDAELGLGAPRPAPEPGVPGEVEAEVEFDDLGALPLPAAAPGVADAAAAPPADGSALLTAGAGEEDAGPAAGAPVAAELALPTDALPAAAKLANGDRDVLAHPLVKLLVERVGGEVLRVERLGKREKK